MDRSNGNPNTRVRLARLLLAGAALGLAPDAAAQQNDRVARPPDVTRRPAEPDTTIGGVEGDGPENRPRVPEAKLTAWFSSMDLDGNAWLSLRETNEGLGFDRGRFRAFDLDKDGRMTRAEYRAFYIDELDAGSVPRPPQTNALAPKEAPRRDAQQLRMAFDRDLDRALDVTEFGALLSDYGRPDVDAKATFARLDGNGDQRLDVGELPRVAAFVDPILKRPAGSGEAPIPRTLDELVGLAEPRLGDSQPPSIAGPVPVFWRLDLDRDGFIGEDDLRALQGRVHLSVSLRAVLTTLDADGDEQLSLLEFAMSLDPDVRPEDIKPAR